MPISLENNPELINEVVRCPKKGKYRDVIKDDCCNTCINSDSILSVEDIQVGLYCLKRKKVVPFSSKCYSFRRLPDDKLPSL